MSDCLRIAQQYLFAAIGKTRFEHLALDSALLQEVLFNQFKHFIKHFDCPEDYWECAFAKTGM